MVQFRPHHFLCTLGFEGKGYSDAFVRGFQEIADRLRADDGSGDEVEIQVAGATDSICEPCPNREGTLCASELKIRKLDRGHAAVLGLRTGQVLTWGDAKQLISEKMSDDAFHAVCAPCAWKQLGVCESALNRLREEQTK
jgi:hypothetical protein